MLPQTDKQGAYTSIPISEPADPPGDQRPGDVGTAQPSVDPNGVNPPGVEVKPKPTPFQMFKSTFGSWFNVLLLAIPVSWALHYHKAELSVLVFTFSFLSIIPLAKLLAFATDELSIQVGQTLAGLLNATMGNAVELIVAVLALKKCELRVVQSSLIGSILSNILLVMGCCFIVGGLRYSEQTFAQVATQINVTLLYFTIFGFVVVNAFNMAVAGRLEEEKAQKAILALSRGICVILLILYCSYLTFQLWTHKELYDPEAVGTAKSVKFKGGRKERLLKMLGSGRLTPKKPKEDGSSTTTAASSSVLWEKTFGRFTSTFFARRTDGDDKTEDDEGNQAETEVTVLRTMDTEDINHGTSGTENVDHSPGGTEEGGHGLAKPDNGPTGAGGAGQSQMKPVEEEEEEEEPQLTLPVSLVLLVLVTVLVAITAEWLVDSIDGLASRSGMSKEFIGLILLPIVGNAAEHATAVTVSWKDKMTLSLGVAIGSSIQIAMFVIPFIVCLGWIIHHPISLLFDPFEISSLALSFFLVFLVTQDGRSNWMEGVMLIFAYSIFCVAYMFYPSSDLTGLLTCTA